MGDAVRDRRVHRNFSDIPQYAEIVVTRSVLGKLSTTCLHRVSGLDTAQPTFADAPHCLRVAREHRDGANVLKDVFGSDRLGTNAALRDRDVRGNVRTEMVAY